MSSNIGNLVYWHILANMYAFLIYRDGPLYIMQHMVEILRWLSC